MIDEQKLIVWIDKHLGMLEGYRRCCNPTRAEWSETKGEYNMAISIKKRIDEIKNGDAWWMDV